MSPRSIAALRVALPLLILAPACYILRGSSGGGEEDDIEGRAITVEDIAVGQGYHIVPVARALNFPTGMTFDEEGRVYVTEAGYSYGERFDIPRLVRIENDGRITEIARGDNPPWNGVAYHKGKFYVAEGGVKRGGSILRIDKEGNITPLITGLPSFGDHHTNGPAIGPDGAIYFGQGTATNSAIVGDDNASFGWLARAPEFHDIPCKDIVLSGKNYEHDGKTTGAFSPFGTPSQKHQIVRGELPCTGAIMKIVDRAGASPELELVAWGLRNPFGLVFSPDGKLYASDNGYDERGSRPVFGSADVLWEIKTGLWYGWPDYSEGRPLADERFRSPGLGKDTPGFLLAQHPNVPPKPLAYFGVHSSSNGFDFSRNEKFGHVGEIFIAQFGDQAPAVGKVLNPVGFKVVRANLETGVITDFAVNRGKTNGPASKVGGGGLERPVAVRFDPSGTSLYVVDFGILAMDDQGAHPHPNTGVLWRIDRAPEHPPIARVEAMKRAHQARAMFGGGLR